MSLRVALSMWAAQNHQHGKVRHEDVDEFGAQEQSVALCTGCTGQHCAPCPPPLYILQIYVRSIFPAECCDWHARDQHADERTCCMARRLIACG